IGELVRAEECTAVIVSHDPESAAIADRIVRIRDGRVSEEIARGIDEEESIVVGRGGWLRLPEELLRRSGIRSHAAARLQGGEIVVLGTDIGKLDRAARARFRRDHVGYVGQQPGLVPALSALENVELALALRNRPPDSARESLVAVGLEDRAEQRVSRLSTGE